jgi:hypothetical protein
MRGVRSMRRRGLEPESSRANSPVRSALAEELEPLWHGAEAYIRTWEAAVRAGHATTREANPDTCRRIREPLQGDDFVTFGESSGWVLRKRDELRGAGCWGLP